MNDKVKPLVLDQLRVGDMFYIPGNARRSKLGGKIIKINPKKIRYQVEYMTGEILTLEADKSEFIEGYMVRHEDL